MRLLLWLIPAFLSAQTVAFPGPGMPASTGGVSLSIVSQGTSGLGNVCGGVAVSSVTCTMTNTPVNGDTLILMGCASAGTIGSVSQTGVTWTDGGGSATNLYCHLWVGAVGSGASTSVVISPPSGTFSPQINVTEWNKALTIDGSVTGASGSSTTPTTASLTPTAALNAVILVFERRGGSATATPSGYTVLNTNSAGTQYAYRIETSTSGSYSGSWTVNASGTWEAEIAAYK